MNLLALFVTVALVAKQLPTLYVIANNTNPLSPQISANAIVGNISENFIKQTGVNQLSQLLQANNGIYLQSLYYDDSNVTFSVRGFGDNATANTLLLLNDEPYYIPNLGSYNLNAFPINNISAIEILPNSAGVMYGDQAVGGVINLRTDNIQPGKMFYFGLGSFNTQDYQAQMANSINQFIKYRLYSRYKKSDNYREHNRYEIANLDVRLDFQKNTTKAFAEYHAINDRLELPGALTAAQLAQNRRAANNDSDFNKQTINLLQLGYQQFLTQNWQLKITNLYQILQGHGVLTTPFTENSSVVAFNPKLVGDIKVFNKSIKAIIGVDLNLGDYQFNGDSYRTGAALNEAGIYQQFTVPLLKKLAFYAGNRNAFAETNLKFTPNQAHNQVNVNTLGLRWDLTPNLNLYLQRAGSFRFPRAEEAALTMQPLKVQTGLSYEMGASYQHDNWDINANIYELNLRNEIVFIPDITNQTFGYNINLPQTKRIGGIVNFGYKMQENWQIKASYAYVQAKLDYAQFNGDSVPMVPRNLLRAESILTLNQYWRWYLAMIVVGSRYVGSDFANLAPKLPFDQVVNTTIMFHYKKIQWNVNVNNILNKKFNAYATVAYQNGLPNTYFYPAAGRNFMMSVTVDL